MKPAERYFMACVSLQGAKRRIETILEGVSDHQCVPSIELMAACISELTTAMAQTHRDRLSDPRFKAPSPGCERGCGHVAEHHVCDLKECHL